MRKLITSVLLTLSLSVHAEEDDSLTRFGDIMQIALPALGLGATYIYDDREGRKQWLYTGVTAMGRDGGRSDGVGIN